MGEATRLHTEFQRTWDVWIYLSSNLKDEQLSNDKNIPFSFLLLMLSEYLSPAHTLCTLEIIRSWYGSPCPSGLNSVGHEELNVPQAPTIMWACSEAAVGQVLTPRPSPLPPPLRIQTEPAEAGHHPCFCQIRPLGFCVAQLE